MAVEGWHKQACSVSNKTDHLTLNRTRCLPSFPMRNQPDILFRVFNLTLCLACIVYNMYVESSRCIKPLTNDEKTIKHAAMIFSFIL